MMAWQKYTLVFKLLSPLHIGHRKVGNLQQTRKYVPGKVIWAALTARLTRDEGKGSEAASYQSIGQLLREHFRFGYFYPALQQAKSTEAPSSEICVEPIYFWKDKLFDYRFLNSSASTAIDYGLQAADEGTLHETEFISPKTRPKNASEPPQQVYLKGDLYVHEEKNLPTPLEKWQTVLSKLQLGSERNTGWGRIELVSDSVLKPEEKSPEVTFENGEQINAHVHTTAGSKIADKIIGGVEPLLGWERATGNNGKVWQLSQPVVCFVPGSRVKEPLKFKISKRYGILEVV